MTPRLTDKLSSDCDEECVMAKYEAIENAARTEEEATNHFSTMVEKAMEIAEHAGKVKEAFETLTEVTSLSELMNKVNELSGNPLSGTEAEEIKNQIEKEKDEKGDTEDAASEFIKNKIKETGEKISESIEKSDQISKAKKKLGSYFTKLRKGIKGINEKFSKHAAKIAGAIQSIAGAIPKLESDSTLEKISGVADIANTVAQFLPPPASMVTGTIQSHL